MFQNQFTLLFLQNLEGLDAVLVAMDLLKSRAELTKKEFAKRIFLVTDANSPTADQEMVDKVTTHFTKMKLKFNVM